MTDRQIEIRRAFSRWCRANRYYTIATMVENPPKYKKRKRVYRGATQRQRYYRDVYLTSDHWAELREAKLIRNPKCQWCGGTEHLVPHHSQYRNLYDVRLSDLVTLCGACHAKNHSRDMQSAFSKFLKEFPEYAYDAPCVESIYTVPQANPVRRRDEVLDERRKRFDEEYIERLTLQYGEAGVKPALERMVRDRRDRKRRRDDKFQVPRKRMESRRANGVWFPSARY